MRAGLWFLALFALAVATSLLARFDQGYVLIVYPPWRVEMSFMLALVLLVGLVALSYLAIRLLRLTLRLPTDVRAWNRQRRSDRGEDEFSRAVAALLAGQPAQAQQLAHTALGKTALPLTALLAAHAAARAGDLAAARQALLAAQGSAREFVAARTALEKQLAEAEAAAKSVVADT